MLCSVEELEKYGVRANDGPIGHVGDFLFDDESWVVRYVVVDTDGWLPRRKILISLMSIGLADKKNKCLRIVLDREKIENSPDIDIDLPVSRGDEMRYFAHYSYPCYWGGVGLWGAGSFPSLMLSDLDGHSESGSSAGRQIPCSDTVRPRQQVKASGSPHEPSRGAIDGAASSEYGDSRLRSCNSVLHYAIEATDGPIGHVNGFLIDEATWAIRQLVVKPSHWRRQRVLIASDRIISVNWLEHTVRVDLSRAAIQQSPSFESADEPGVDYKPNDRNVFRTSPAGV
ncbi:MAG: PRC-barrel domain-containing protein [Rhodanobacter sp.]